MIKYNISNKKGQSKLDFSLVTQSTNNQESTPETLKNSEKPLSYDEFKLLDSCKGLKDDEIMVLFEIAQKRRNCGK